MNILIMTIPVTVFLITIFVLIFLSAVRKRQFEDLDTPAHFPLSDNSDEDQNAIKQNKGEKRDEQS